MLLNNKDDSEWDTQVTKRTPFERSRNPEGFIGIDFCKLKKHK